MTYCLLGSRAYGNNWKPPVKLEQGHPIRWLGKADHSSGHYQANIAGHWRDITVVAYWD